APDAAWRRAANERVRAEAEIATLPVRQQLYEARQRVQERAVALARRKLELLLAQLADLREAQVAALQERVRAQAEAALADGGPAAADFARANIDHAGRLAQRETDLAAARSDAIAAARDAARTDDVLRATEARLALGGRDDAVALTLLRERARLDEAAALAERRAQVRRRLDSARLRLIDLDEAREALDDAEVDPDDGTLRALRDAQRELIDELAESNRQLVSALSATEVALQTQAARLQRLDELLSRRLLWTPGHAPVDRAWLARHGEGWRSALRAADPGPALVALGTRDLGVLAILASGLALAVVGLVARLRLGARLAHLAAPLQRVRTDTYAATLAAAAATAIAALPAAALATAAGLALLLAPESRGDRAVAAFSAAFLGSAPLLYLVALFPALARDGGLGDLHLRWTAQRRRALRTLRGWLLALLPLQFGLVLLFRAQQEPALDIVARDLLLGWCLVVGLALWRLLAPEAVWHSRRMTPEPSAARRLLRVVLPVGAVLLMVLTLLGYTVTVGAMLLTFWQSCLALTAIAIVRGLIERWFLLGERRIALRRYEERREAARASDEGDGGGEFAVEVDPDNLPLERVSAQRRRLLRALTLGLLVMAALLIWGPLLPALERLDDIRPWASETSLRSVLYGAVVLLATAVAARNLPGLFEVGLQSRTHLDASTRYAITSISRYLIVIGGVVGGFALLGVRWGNLQWMAAALTVGLGFGLQEIFANFVSGIILLIERPVRIGDLITIGEFTGTVTKVRTRATTILDWDNREVVVPNKTFITDRLINWTLTDTHTRLNVAVTVARDSDAETVHRILMDAARATPTVMDEPAPWTHFAGIGPNGLNFALYVHVRALNERIETQNALNARIVRGLADAGIEIAFTRMDVQLSRALAQRMPADPGAAGEGATSPA
ncbi:mechanosensitive ion channel domain-containing protein, partial [Coralloluteibacterium stylophorae]|uniref:mechanosensitive ion channel domain-containing protein n=1 Tax=Coralloluteibacterium stylophorae TaxID=1776034 RepID=UPI0036160F53